MNGAELEMAGQVRGTFPYMVSQGVSVPIALVAGFVFAETPLLLPQASIPFDRGPDKAARVFIGFNGCHSTARSDAGTTSIIRGQVYYRGNNGKITYLTVFNNALDTTGIVKDGSAMRIMPESAIAGESVNDFGKIGFADAGSALGTATTITITLFLNIGLYAQFATPDWETLFAMKQHEHQGLCISFGDNE